MFIKLQNSVGGFSFVPYTQKTELPSEIHFPPLQTSSMMERKKKILG